jgi:hypothetical protein
MSHPGDQVDQQEPSFTPEASSEPALRLPIVPGLALFLEYRIGGQSIKLKTTLVGFREDEYLIIQTPRKEGTVLALPEGAELIIRFLASGRVYGFPAHVLRVLGPPFYLAFLAYPHTCEKVSLRNSPRIPVVIPISREGGDFLKECVINISRAGALLLLTEPPAEEILKVSFHLPTGESIADLPCTVIRSERTDRGVLVGVHFQGESVQLKPLAHYLARSLEVQEWFPGV